MDNKPKGILGCHSKPELEELINEGYSQHMISKKYGLSQSTIRHWLKKFDLKTKNKSFKDGYKGQEYDYSLTERKCSSCSLVKNVGEFYKRSDREGQYQSLCKECSSNSHVNNKNLILEYKGNCCEICKGSYKERSYHLHHKDPTYKEFLISRYSNTKNIDKLKPELDKCHLLCVNCHRETHYGLHPEFLIEKVDEVIPEIQGETRKCNTCNEERSVEDFYKKASSCWCKPCRKKQKKQDKRDDKRNAIEYKGGKCEHCGYDKCDAVFDFHHKNPKEKDFGISTSGKRFGADIKKELDKCLLLCGNCHNAEHQRLDEEAEKETFKITIG